MNTTASNITLPPVPQTSLPLYLSPALRASVPLLSTKNPVVPVVIEIEIPPAPAFLREVSVVEPPVVEFEVTLTPIMDAVPAVR